MDFEIVCRSHFQCVLICCLVRLLLKYTELIVLFILSVVSGHQHISRTAIREVLAHEIPSKFRVLAHLVDFHPNTLEPSEFVRQLCSKCFLLLVFFIFFSVVCVRIVQMLILRIRTNVIGSRVVMGVIILEEQYLL